MDGKYNTRSPAVKRLMREAAELSQPAPEYFAAPLEDNLFEWHFTVRGPEDSDFQGGVFHGRIIVPSEYPMKPPDIVLLTPNGRFEVGKKICLSISGFHPETWQPSWSIRTALLAIIGFMPTDAKSYEVGAVSYPADERKKLARQSHDWVCSTCKCKPSSLLASDSQESNINAEEVKEIVNSFQLKGSDSSTVNPAPSPDKKETKVASSSPPASIPEGVSLSPTSSALSEASQSIPTAVNDSAIDEASEQIRGSSLFFGLQFTDFVIAMLFLILAFLLYRRFSGQVFMLENGDNSSVSDFE